MYAEYLIPGARYGLSEADQILVNRYYSVGYSYHFRQAKWAAEVLNADPNDVERSNNFRPDYRVREMFRADLVDYEYSGYDRGHLIPSADQREDLLQNSETFLLSNVCPQAPGFNRGIWFRLEKAIRELDARPEILETNVICGPVFYFSEAVKFIGEDEKNMVTLPIANAYFKCVLTEDINGSLSMWSFLLKNEKSDAPLSSFQVTVKTIEKYVGICLWGNLRGHFIEKQKNSIEAMWSFS